MRRHGKSDDDPEFRDKSASSLTKATEMQYVNISRARAREKESKLRGSQITNSYLRGFLKFKLFKVLTLVGAVSLGLYAFFTYKTITKDALTTQTSNNKDKGGNEVVIDDNNNIVAKQQVPKPANNIPEKEEDQNDSHIRVDGKLAPPPVEIKVAPTDGNEIPVDEKVDNVNQEPPRDQEKKDGAKNGGQKAPLGERQQRQKEEKGPPAQNKPNEGDALIQEQHPHKEEPLKLQPNRSQIPKQEEEKQPQQSNNKDQLDQAQKELGDVRMKQEIDSRFENHVLLILTNAATKPSLRDKFELTVSSILQHSSIDLNFFIVTDKAGEKHITEIFTKIKQQNLSKVNYQKTFLSAEALSNKLMDQVSNIRDNTQAGTHKYYMDSIFYLSVAIHKDVLPPQIKRLVMIDSDLKFVTDIKKLFALFDEFSPSNIIGIAHEQQPVYRHLFSLYRSRNPGTLVGNPPPDGLTGFNSGVMLLDLEKMRASTAYNNYLVAKGAVQALTEKYYFKGHLGDQDFYTLLSMDHRDLFFVLPCSFNRQLCQWWRDKGYQQIFDQYFLCPEPINIYHGNCNTPIP